jgi:hypothetical protein
LAQAFASLFGGVLSSSRLQSEHATVNGGDFAQLGLKAWQLYLAVSILQTDKYVCLSVDVWYCFTDLPPLFHYSFMI